MKLILIFALITTFISLALSRSQFWGKRVAGDRMIISRNVTIYPRAKVIPMHLFKFPLAGRSNDRLITAVQVLDNFRNNSGVTPILKVGGPGRTFTTVLLQGQSGRGFNASVILYGR
uniref:Salivary secreted peptide n=1 Tax=Stomoxys calcitrans TaxID=35570 RepID=A0A1I8Q1C6_STOCA